MLNDSCKLSLSSPAQLGKLTVAVLKTFLQSVGRRATGKKQDLVGEVEDYFATAAQ